MYTRQPLDVEFHFDIFVKDYGGKLISDIIDSPPSFKNADYIFERDGVVAELKCLKKNIFEDKNYIYKLNQLITKWYLKGWMSNFDVSKWSLGNQNLTDKCLNDFIRLAKPLLEDSLRKANKQLKETIENLELNEYEGIVVIVNDGNYGIENMFFHRLIGNILNLPKFKDSCVDGYIYTTVNMPTLNLSGSIDAGVWAPAYRGEDKTKLRTFVDKLGDAWLKYYIKNIEKKKIKIIKSEESNLISEMKFLPKDFPRDRIIWDGD
ncbi:MAG: hypothetical protein K8I03_07670 [Ignavibacteria bacterium]|nr:hypothetical protein [Ignavibacteria bacterium]